MNLVLFELEEIGKPLSINDPRAIHLLTILRLKPGKSFDAGIIDGPRGKAHFRKKTDEGLMLDFEPGPRPPDPEPIILLVGLPRPQTARKILREAAAIGVGAIHFHLTSRGDPGYARSTLWTSGEYRRHLIAGTEQSFTTRLPTVSHGKTIEEVLTGLGDIRTRLALDNYESQGRLMDIPLPGPPVALAVGPERGWTGSERNTLKMAGFRLIDLGSRVLRSETAVVAGLTLLRARFGW